MNTRREFVAGALALGVLPAAVGAAPFDLTVRPVEGDATVPELRDFAGAEPNVVEADEPFRVNPI